MTLGDIFAIAGPPEEGLKQLREALNLIGTTRECWAEAEMHRLRENYC